MEDILKQLIEVIGEALPNLDVSGVTMETHLQNDLGLNSLNMMLLAISIEDKFDLSLWDDVMPTTVGDVCRLIEAAQ